jgi:hypothetical protein
MMLIATGLAAALLAAASFIPEIAEAPAVPTSSPAPPPVVVNVFTAPGVPPTLVSRLLAETSAIWRASGLEFVWQRTVQEAVPYTRLTEMGPYQSSTLRVVIGDQRGWSRGQATPLGWIVFDDEHEPQREIYLSYANAKSLMEAARQVVGVLEQMPPAQCELLLGRAMGRALAHELGHYLLASKVHTERGLMKASRTASELFVSARAGFRIDAAQRQQIAARMRGESLVVSR